MRIINEGKIFRFVLTLCALLLPFGFAGAGMGARMDAGAYAAAQPAVGRTVTNEIAANEYVGSRDYLDVLFNIDFQDIGASWARDAIYEGGALGIIKGFGAAAYGGQAVMTKGQAIALAVRAAGLEGAAQSAGEALEAANRRAGKAPTGAETIWLNGCLKIAADRGLISKEDYGAGIGDAAAQAISPFRRDAPAQRQEFAYWLARILGIAPVREQQSLFTFYSDWKDVDSLYAPYIEAVLNEKIMGGDPLGRLGPRDGITREQAAQIIKNASKYVFKINNFIETTGTIENIASDSASAPEGANAEVMRTVYYIRNQRGQLDTIATQIAAADSAGAASANRRETGLVVNADGALEDETALRRGDRIRYVSSKNRTPGYPDEIRYVELLQGPRARAYLLAQIDNIDPVNRRMAFTQIAPVEYPAAGELRRAAEEAPETYGLSADYFYSADVTVKSNGEYIDAGELAPGMAVIIGVENAKNLFYIETTGFGWHLGEAGIARGVIEENNPALGYVAMYSESGDRGGVKSLGREGELPELLIYGYADPARVEVRKDGFPATIGALSPGDSAYVKFDAAGGLTAVSAVTNYKQRYGTVVSVIGDSAIIRFEGDGGTAHSVGLRADALYFMNYRLVGKSALTPGSSVRVLLQDMGGSTVAREITIMGEGDRGLIGNVYKAVLSRFDAASQKAVIFNVQKLEKGKWVRADRKGVDTIELNADTRVYLNDMSVTIAQADKLLRGAEVYIAAKNDYGGVEVAAQISVGAADNKEQLYDDTVKSVRRATGSFDLAKGPSDINAGDWTIVVRDGKLVSGAVIGQDDLVYVVASREDASGRLRAEVVEIGDRAAGPKIHVYRGRVIRIVQNKEFTLESFSELDLAGTEWKYANTPKTFSITFDTLLLTAGGIAPIGGFDGRGANDYTNPPRAVYVLSDGTDALAVSTASFGIENVRGEIVSVDGKTADDDGKVLAEPAGVTLVNVSYYDRNKYAWTPRKGDMAVTIPPDALIIKNGAPVRPSELRRADKVRVIKSGAAAAGDGYIVIVEN